MNRRDFIKNSAALAASTVVPSTLATAKESSDTSAEFANDESQEKLIASAPVLQNYAATSMGVAFAVSDMANGFVTYSEHEDMRDSVTVKCGGYRVTDMNSDIMLVRLTGLKPATRYYYYIGADRISYKGGYSMKITGTETDPRKYSFVTAGADADAHFCVINDTHARWEPFGRAIDKIAELAPSCVVWNGDASNSEETINAQKRIFFNPEIARKDYASETPYLLCPGNHDSRGMANRHLERAWMYRQPEERSSRDWDLGRNFAVRMGDIAMIGLDTAEDKVDENPIFAGLFNSASYREAQVAWLSNALKRKEIATAPFLVAFCHIPLFDPDPRQNPGDIHPNDTDPQYTTDYAHWQRDCNKLWVPLLEKAGCQLIITAHQHKYRFDAPDDNRKWAQIVGGGPILDGSDKFATVIEGKVENRKLIISVHNLDSGRIQDEFVFSRR